jgi:hypothetical protein
MSCGMLVSDKPTYQEFAATFQRAHLQVECARPFCFGVTFSFVYPLIRYDGLLHWCGPLGRRRNWPVAIEPRMEKTAKGSYED